MLGLLITALVVVGLAGAAAYVRLSAGAAATTNPSMRIAYDANRLAADRAVLCTVLPSGTISEPHLALWSSMPDFREFRVELRSGEPVSSAWRWYFQSGLRYAGSPSLRVLAISAPAMCYRYLIREYLPRQNSTALAHPIVSNCASTM